MTDSLGISPFLLFKPLELMYNFRMDDRKRQIGEAEQRKKDQGALLDALLARVGESVLERMAEGGDGDAASFVELAAYARLQGDVAGYRDSIRAAEEQMRRFKEFEEDVEAKERAEALHSRELAGMHARLGKILLEETCDDDGAYGEFCAPYRVQAEELVTKVRSLEDRLLGLEHREKGNVFTWIGKSAQGLVLRSFLGKAQESLEQLRRSVGERFTRRGTGSLFPENAAVDALLGEAERKGEERRAVARELVELREEKRKISDAFSADGGPAKHVQSLNNQIAQAQAELRTLYRGVGEAAALGSPDSDRARSVGPFLGPNDAEDLDGARRISRAIEDCDAVVEKLRASLAVDEEKAKIDRCRRMIQERKDKIAQAEKNILELEAAIRDSEESVEKLRKLL